MTIDNTSGLGPGLSRRDVLAGSGGVVTALSGCLGAGSDPSGGGPAGSGDSVDQLKAGGSSTVYLIVDKASSFWNANLPPSGEESWDPDRYGIRTTENLADYWAGKYGFAPRERGPPFEVVVSLSNTGTGLDQLREEQLDIGNASTRVERELTGASDEELEKFADHVVGVGTSPIVVSRAVYDAGVDVLTADEAAGIYRGELANWSDIDRYDGPDRTIQAIGRTPGSATEGLFKANVLGDAEAEMSGVDVRKGENQQVQTIVANSNNAIGYLAEGFVTEDTPAVTLVVDGTEYRPGENLSDPGYPLARPLHCYTYEETSRAEAAFLRMILEDFGQEEFVESAGYSTLSDERQREELERLPEPEARTGQPWVSRG